MARSKEMIEEHSPATGELPGSGGFPTSENTLDAPTVTEARAESDAGAITEKVSKKKKRYRFVLQQLDGIAITIHEAHFVATGSKGVAQYLRRVAGNMAVLDDEG